MFKFRYTSRKSAATYAAAVIVGVLLMSVGSAMLGACLASARTVPLEAASVPATEQAYLYAGSRVTYAFPAPDGTGNCRYHGQNATPFFSDVQAYRWNGHAFAHEQHWNGDGTVSIWRDASGRSVTFDGIAFRNHTHNRVIVAGWCD